MTSQASPTPEQDAFERSFGTIKKFWHGAGYHLPLRCLEFAKPYHIEETRENSNVPGFQHQVDLCFAVWNMRFTLVALGLDPEYITALVVLHDTYEDYAEKYNINADVLLNIAKPHPRAEELVSDVIRMSKYRPAGPGEPRIKLKIEDYFDDISQKVELMITKLLDSGHNTETLEQVPSEKLAKQIFERRRLLSVAKSFIRRYPQYTDVIYPLRVNIKRNIRICLGIAQAAVAGRFHESVQALVDAELIPPGRHFVRNPALIGVGKDGEQPKIA